MTKSFRALSGAAAAAFLALCAYAGAFLWQRVNAPVLCQAAAVSYTKTVRIKGIAVREEEPISSLPAAFEDGARIPAGANELTGRAALCCEGCDGLEYLSPAMLCPERVDGLIASKPGIAGSARLIYGCAWYVAAISEEDVPEGVRVGLMIDGCDTSVNGRVIASENGRIIIRLTEGLTVFDKIRQISASLALESVDGLQISTNSVRFEGGESFVYVILSNIVEKRRIEVLYVEDGITVVSRSRESDELHAGDSVIVSGENIYEGRVIRKWAV